MSAHKDSLRAQHPDLTPPGQGGRQRRGTVVATQAEDEFVPAVIVDEQPAAERKSGAEPAIVVELASGARVSIGATATVSMVSAALRALR